MSRKGKQPFSNSTADGIPREAAHPDYLDAAMGGGTTRALATSSDEIRILRHTLSSDPATDYGLYCRPALLRLLRSFDLDAVYLQAEGDYLWQRREDGITRVLDFAGGFGAGLFGHNHPDLIAEAHRLLDARAPVMAQGSCRSVAGRLAKRLCNLVGADFLTIIVNSGTEAVEAAIKHAHLETGGSIFWALRGAFHGKTCGAMQLTWNSTSSFRDWGPTVRFIDPENPDDWHNAKAETAGRVAGVFIEPILGEGGVKPLRADFVAWLKDTCAEANIPIIADEIQTGMGRTGSFLASTSLNLQPDYVCLAKSLGGGLAKIGAVMIKRCRFVPDFAINQTSTFAEDDPSCSIALKALEILDRDDLPARCKAAGEKLKSDLSDLQASVPGTIREIRGEGLMIGIELSDQSRSPSNIIKILSDHDYLGWAVAAYMLNVHNIRVMPTLGNPFTLRVQPSAYVSNEDLERFVSAMACACQAIEVADAGHLTGFVTGTTVSAITDYRSLSKVKHQDAGTRSRVAFVGHWILPDLLARFDRSLAAIPNAKLSLYAEKFAPLSEPSINTDINIKSTTGDEVHLKFIGLNFTAQQIVNARRSRDLALFREKIEAAVRLAHDNGCKVIGLGGYTSSCRRLSISQNVIVTSGNSLTAGMAIQALREAAVRRGIDMKQSSIAIVGAPGSIASKCAICLAKEVAGMCLIGRRADSSRMRALAHSIKDLHADLSLTVSDDMHAVAPCSLVIAATVAGGSLIQAEHLGPLCAVVCDISLPSDVAPSVYLKRPDVTVIDGGVVRLPFNRDLEVPGIPLEGGRVYACMAETLLIGLEPSIADDLLGAASPDDVNGMMTMAKRHGFALDRLQP